jgi:hypothetical protein
MDKIALKKIFFKEFERKMSKIKSNFGPKIIGVICGYACWLEVQDIKALLANNTSFHLKFNSLI